MSEESVSAEEVVFSEDAIEQAYQMALRASEEAGMLPPVPEQGIQRSGNPPQSETSAIEQADLEKNSEQNSSQQSRIPQFQPKQIIEALLFVGGEKLTAKKLAQFIGHQCPDERIHEYIEQINTHYEQQKRPYEIVLGDEGFQMSLKSEYQKQRHLLYGLGPREVKLSQDALEVLSVIAFEQPVTRGQLDQLDRNNTMTMLRQLIRRELVSSARNDSGELEYCTTDRFLSLFGLESVDDLPRTPDLKFK